MSERTASRFPPEIYKCLRNFQTPSDPIITEGGAVTRSSNNSRCRNTASHSLSGYVQNVKHRLQFIFPSFIYTTVNESNEIRVIKVENDTSL